MIDKEYQVLKCIMIGTCDVYTSFNLLDPDFLEVKPQFEESIIKKGWRGIWITSFDKCRRCNNISMAFVQTSRTNTKLGLEISRDV